MQVSMLILVFLSLERFLLIAVPLSGYQVLKLKTAVYSMASIWLIGTIIAVAPRKFNTKIIKVLNENKLYRYDNNYQIIKHFKLYELISNFN